MPNQIGPHLEQRIIAFALARPGLGPRRISSELSAREGERGRDPDLRARRLAGAAALQPQHPLEAPGACRPPRRALRAAPADRPGRAPHRRGGARRRRCRWIASSSAAYPAAKGSVWQYTAADVASGFVWAELHSADRNPRARHTAELVHRVARELKAAGWKLGRGDHRQWLGIRLAGVRPGTRRPKTLASGGSRPGARTQTAASSGPSSTIFEECWRPAFAILLAPKITALRRDLDEYLDEFNFDRAHNGRLTQGRIPGDIVFGARKMGTVR